MFGFTDSMHSPMNASSNRTQRSAPEGSLHHWELDWASGLVNSRSTRSATHNNPSADELGLFLEKALALAG